MGEGNIVAKKGNEEEEDEDDDDDNDDDDDDDDDVDDQDHDHNAHMLASPSKRLTTRTSVWVMFLSTRKRRPWSLKDGHGARFDDIKSVVNNA
ncbi:hypothetical protein ElyMa_000472000 [Elysia marginata]|uniref:Uncharacterized protein n=1 Tax=Elysia marginata TaxID=1093978 RepID=A0AAV4FS69_9GAST|nr:hypothetical protein ElyMa_000472000 [Elysia marginata]